MASAFGLGPVRSSFRRRLPVRERAAPRNPPRRPTRNRAGGVSGRPDSLSPLCPARHSPSVSGSGAASPSPCAGLSSKPRAQGVKRATKRLVSELSQFFLRSDSRKSVCFSFPVSFAGRSSAIMADEGGGSRLDRLLRLLETGSTPAARHEAARQIGELASAHPNQLPNLLRRVRTPIRNRAGARPPRRVRFALRRRSRGTPRGLRVTSPVSSARARS